MMSFSLANRRTSWRLAKRLHLTYDVLTDYAATVGRYLNAGVVAVDVGGGKRCEFASLNHGARIVAVDISAAELSRNTDVTEIRVCDATKELPFSNDSVTVVGSCAVVEHLNDVDAYVRHAARILAPGGVLVTAFPSKWAMSSILNRLIPHRVVRWMLKHLYRDRAERCGFRAYYQYCTPAAFRLVLTRHGFRVVETKVSYFQADYYAFFFPLFCLALIWDWTASRIGERACAACLIVAEKATNGNATSLH